MFRIDSFSVLVEWVAKYEVKVRGHRRSRSAFLPPRSSARKRTTHRLKISAKAHEKLDHEDWCVRGTVGSVGHRGRVWWLIGRRVGNRWRGRNGQHGWVDWTHRRVRRTEH